MANESPAVPWDPNPQPQGPVGVVVPPHLENHLQPPEEGNFSKAVEEIESHQIVVPPAPVPEAHAPIQTPIGQGGVVEIKQTPVLENQASTQPVAGDSISFDANKFLADTPLMKSAESTNQQPTDVPATAEQASDASVPKDADAQTFVQGNESTSQGTDSNGYPMAEGTSQTPPLNADAPPPMEGTQESPVPDVASSPIVAEAQEKPVQVEAPAGPPIRSEPVAVKNESTTESNLQAEPMAAEAPITPEPAPQAVGTIIDSTSETDNSTTRKNWRKFGETLPNIIQSVNTRVTTAINNSVGPKQTEDVPPAEVTTSSTDKSVEPSNISPFGDELPPKKDEQPQQTANVIPFPARPSTEARFYTAAPAANNESSTDLTQDDESSPVTVPTPIRSRDDTTHEQELSQQNQDIPNPLEAQNSQAQENPEDSNEQSTPSPEEQLAEAISNAQKVEEEGLLRAAVAQREYELATEQAREAAKQINMLKQMKPNDFITIKSIYTGKITPISQHTFEELRKAA